MYIVNGFTVIIYYINIVVHHRHILYVDDNTDTLDLPDLLTKFCWDIAEEYCKRRGFDYKTMGPTFMLNVGHAIYHMIDEQSTKNGYVFMFDEKKMAHMFN